MNRRSFIAAIAALPLVGRLFFKNSWAEETTTTFLGTGEGLSPLFTTSLAGTVDTVPLSFAEGFPNLPLAATNIVWESRCVKDTASIHLGGSPELMDVGRTEYRIGVRYSDSHVEWQPWNPSQWNDVVMTKSEPPLRIVG